MNQNEREILMQKFADANRKLLIANEKLEAANLKLKEYEEKAAKAEKASRMKSLFLANMSHEIRTPLNAIEGFSRVIAETDSPEERMKYMEIIESNNNRLMSLINEILDLSRVESGEIVIKKSPVHLEALCLKTFWRNIDNFIGSGPYSGEHKPYLFIAQGTIDIGGRNAGSLQGKNLIPHEGNQGRNDKSNTGKENCRDLITKAFPAASWHDAKDISPA